MRKKYGNGELCDMLCQKLGIKWLLGMQPRLDRGDFVVETCMRDSIQPEKFTTDSQYLQAAGFNVVGAYPATAGRSQWWLLSSPWR